MPLSSPAPMGLTTALLLAVSAFFAGALNAAAGGGSFLTFPALIFAGVPAVIANATSTVALMPGSLASAFSYRSGFARLERISLRAMLGFSLCGGVLGAFLLLYTPENTFEKLTPCLLLFATLMFTFGRQISTELKKRIHFGFASLAMTQFVIAIYGGYFGGGIGILMLAALAIFGLTDLVSMNGLKTLLGGTLNAVAAAIFIFKGIVWWRQGLVMMTAAIAGGYFGAVVAQRVPAKALRWFVIAVGVSMTAYFFVRVYGPANSR